MKYVIVGYILTYGTLLGYIGLLAARLRRARQRAGGQS